MTRPPEVEPLVCELCGEPDESELCDADACQSWFIPDHCVACCRSDEDDEP